MKSKSRATDKKFTFKIKKKKAVIFTKIYKLMIICKTEKCTLNANLYEIVFK